MDDANRTMAVANQTPEEEPFDDAVYERLVTTISLCPPDPQVVRAWYCDMLRLGLTVCQQTFCIPQRLYCQGTAIAPGAVHQIIFFATIYGGDFPAELALAGKCEFLVDGDSPVFTEQVQTINLRIEVFDLSRRQVISHLTPMSQWPGYDGWGAQVSTLSCESTG
jgi:hypothetical protein